MIRVEGWPDALERSQPADQVVPDAGLLSGSAKAIHMTASASGPNCFPVSGSFLTPPALSVVADYIRLLERKEPP
jgi:hypothetical protein